MVNRLYSALLGLPLIVTTLQVQAQARISVEQDTLELGKQLRLNIIYRPVKAGNIHKPEIDLTPLEKDFHIEVPGEPEFDRIKGLFSQQLKLSPYHTGKQTIPSIKVDEEISNQLDIMVSDPVNPKTGNTMLVEHNVSHSRLWQHQQFSLITELITNSDIRQLIPDTAKHKGITFRTLPLIKQADVNTQHYHTGWFATINQTGLISLKLPAVRLVVDGITTHSFYPPPLTLNVEPLPVYIPGTIPVGDVRLSLTKPPIAIFQGSLQTLEYELIGKTLNPDELPDITQQMDNTRELRFYPATKTGSAEYKLSSASSKLRYRIPYKINNQGIYRLPDLKIDYFDPATGTLKTGFYPGQKMLVLHPWLFYSIAMLIVLTIIFASWRALTYTLRLIKRLRTIRSAHFWLQRASSSNELRQAIRFCATAAGYSDNITPRQWLMFIVSGTDEKNLLANQLEQLFYTNKATTIEIEPLAQQLALAYRHSLNIFGRTRVTG